MVAPYSRRTAFILLLVLSLLSRVCAQSCNTNQNPYCAGNSQFAQLCCPYPAVCYYANRYGAVGCCQPGKICIGTGVTIIPLQSTPITQMQTPQPTPTTQNGVYSTVTITNGLAATTVASANVASVVTTVAITATAVATPVGYTTTAGVIIANDASRPLVARHATHFSAGLAILAWIMT